MKFFLELDLDNDAMRTIGDLNATLAGVAASLERKGDREDAVPAVPEGRLLRDINGNKIGTWRITP